MQAGGIESKTVQSWNLAQLKLLDSLKLNIIEKLILSPKNSENYGERKVISFLNIFSELEQATSKKFYFMLPLREKLGSSVWVVRITLWARRVESWGIWLNKRNVFFDASNKVRIAHIMMPKSN